MRFACARRIALAAMVWIACSCKAPFSPTEARLLGLSESSALTVVRREPPVLLAPAASTAGIREGKAVPFEVDLGPPVPLPLPTFQWSVTSSHEALLPSTALGVDFPLEGSSETRLKGVLRYRGAAHAWGSATLTLNGLSSDGVSVSRSLAVTIEPLSFRVSLSASGLSRTHEELDFNGVNVLPFLSYELGGAGAVAGVTPRRGTVALAPAGSGLDPIAAVETPLTEGDRALRFRGGRYLRGTPGSALSTGFGAGEDVALEFSYRTALASVTSELLGQMDFTARKGWQVLDSRSLGRTTVTFSKSSSTFCAAYGPSDPGAWHHVMVFLDRSEPSTAGLMIYINGVPGTVGGNCALVDDVLQAIEPLTLGFGNGGGAPSQSELAFLRIWKRPGAWPGGSANLDLWGRIAQERALRYMGVYPDHAAGSARPFMVMAGGSTSAGYVDLADPQSGVRKLHRVGRNWSRIVRRLTAQTGVAFTGYYPEANYSNYAVYSEQFNTTLGWTPSGASVAADRGIPPTDLQVADALIADATLTTNHQLTSVTAPIPNNIPSLLSVWARAGSQAGVVLASSQDPQAFGCFRLNGSGAVVATGSSVTASTIENWGNGWYRVGIRFNQAALNAQIIFRSVTETCGAHAGNGVTESLYLWGAQLERSNTNFSPGSFRPTGASSDSRGQDLLRFSLADGNLESTATGQLSLQVLNPPYVTGTYYPASLLDSSDAVGKFHRLTTTRTVVGFQAGALQVTTPVNAVFVYDGESHSLRARWGGGVAGLTVDSVTASNGVVFAEIPSLNVLAIGEAGLGVVQHNGIIREVVLRAVPE
jgi:hypothetical protein